VVSQKPAVGLLPSLAVAMRCRIFYHHSRNYSLLLGGFAQIVSPLYYGRELRRICFRRWAVPFFSFILLSMPAKSKEFQGATTPGLFLRISAKKSAEIKGKSIFHSQGLPRGFSLSPSAYYYC
jgi:hypothetical protein